jgi:multidrug efflux pump subunit AcrB
MQRQELSKGPISWMARNPVASNLLMMALLISGLISAYQIKKEVFPEFTIDMVIVSVAYPGASPEEVERGVILAIEEQVRTLDGVKKVTSTASEGIASVVISLDTSANPNKALADVKNALDRITSFPDEIEEPEVSLPAAQKEILTVVLYGELEEKALTQLAENFRDSMLQIAGVGSVNILGTRPYEINIETSQESLRNYGLTLGQIANRIRNYAMDLPGGGIKTPSGEVLLRTQERRDIGEQFGTIPIIQNSNARAVTLGELAHIDDGFEDQDVYARFNGMPAVSLSITTSGANSPMDVAARVRDFLDKEISRLPEGIGTTISNDVSKVFENRIDMLLQNSMLGLALVLLILGLFLEPKLAFWVSLGIPISFMGSFFLLPLVGVSLNMISTFAFLVTLGMVVDDAIVVGENAFRLRKEGVPPLEAAIKGTKEMATPIFFAVFTTIAAFSPILFAPGIMGKIIYGLPVIVVTVLSLSLLESFFILPAHLAHSKPLEQKGIWIKVLTFQKKFSQRFENFIQTYYRNKIEWIVHNRGITLAVAFSVFLGSLGLITGGWIKTVDFPKDDKEEVAAQAIMPYGIDIAETEKVAVKLEDAATRALEKLGGPQYARGILTSVGALKTGGLFGRTRSGSHMTSVTVMLVGIDDRDFGSNDFVELWQKEMGPISTADSLAFSSSMHGFNKPIDFVISHRDISALEEAAKEVSIVLASQAGVKNVDDGIELGKPQWDFKLTPEGTNAGLTVSDLAMQMRNSFYGAEALRQQRGRHEIKVMVRLPKDERQSMQVVENLMLHTPGGGKMPLAQAATVTEGRAYKTISRTDGRRTLRIQADVDDTVANANEVQSYIIDTVMPQIEPNYSGLSYGLIGRQEDMSDFFSFILTGFGIAAIAIYALVAIPLGSYLQPLFVVMAAIPFGLVGAVGGHILLGESLSMFSMMGVLALAGVVVNDSIVYVSTANRLRQAGQSPFEAAVNAACTRFRPIFLTTMTTFFGLAPMILETSPGAKMIVPMAISLGFGILISTTFVLTGVPALFVIVENIRFKWALWKEPDGERAKEARSQA